MGRLRFHLFLQEFDSPEIVNKRCCLYGAVMPRGRGCNLLAEAGQQCSLTHFNTPAPWARDAAGSLEHTYSTKAQECMSQDVDGGGVSVENRNHMKVSFILFILWNVI